jgi:hypothetical protein
MTDTASNLRALVDEATARLMTIGEMRDYVTHLQHHLRQILE